MRWAWHAVSSESCLAAPKFVAKHSKVVLYAFILNLGVLFWSWLAVSLWHVIYYGGGRTAEEWNRRRGAVRERALPGDEEAAEAADAVAAAERRTASAVRLNLQVPPPGLRVRFSAGGRIRLGTIDTSVSDGIKRFADLARIPIMTDAGDAHLQNYESQIAVAKGNGQLYRLSAEQRDTWRTAFLRDSPFLWWLQALKLPLRGSRSNPGVREIAGGRAVLYL